MKLSKSALLTLGFFFVTMSQLDACAVCFSAKEGARGAFYITTAVLTFLPLALISGVIFWLKKKLKAQESEEEI